MRPIWTGAISFGLVNIPVKLYSAVEDSTLDLDMLDKNDHANIKFQRVNENTGKVVKYEDIVKGYQYEGEYVILEDEDFQRANAHKSKTIDILEFGNETEVESIYYEHPYYLEPDKSGERAYALLREALRETKRVALANFVMRNKETLAVIKPLDEVLVLNRIRFSQEIRPISDLKLPAKSLVKESEMKMALALIDQLTKELEIVAHRDTYTDELMKVIEEKAQGKETKIIKLDTEPVKSKDLMAQLKASLERKAS